MASLKSLINEKVGQLFGKELAVESVRDLSPHFRRFHITGSWLRGATWSAGDKLQIMIVESGPRTYTPFARDAATGSFDLLAFVHGDTPGATWIKNARPGLRFHAVGPRGSLPLATLPGPVVFFGDETSFGAAASLQQTRGAGNGVSFVFESTHPDEAELVLSELGLERRTVVQRQSTNGHLDEVDAAIRAALAQSPQAQLVLTGHAQTIQFIRSRLKAQPATCAGQKVKAYWADGKRGLD
jgi:NADPH-dependent ferric siderophore reductase